MFNCPDCRLHITTLDTIPHRCTPRVLKCLGNSPYAVDSKVSEFSLPHVTTTTMMDAPLVSDDGEVLEEREGEIWVRSGDNVQDLADHIDAVLVAGLDYCDLACIGAGAVNQAVKAVAVFREMAADSKYTVNTQPYFSNITDDQQRRRTRMMLRVTAVPA
jgi:stage V sporulation protein SpoVS